MSSGIGEKIGAAIGTAIKTGSPVTQVKEGIGVLADTVDRFIETPDERRKEQAAGLTAIIELNKIEAAHPSLFVAGWRPFIGWVCGAGLAFQFVLRPILNWLLLVIPREIEPLPSLEIDQLISLIVSMLGLAGYRSYEKLKGKSRENLGSTKKFNLFSKNKAA